METCISQRVLDIVSRDMEAPCGNLDATFEELGLDSLDFILLLQSIRTEIGPLPEDRAVKAHTVRDLVNAIQS